MNHQHGRVTILQEDMPPSMRNDAIDIALRAFHIFGNRKPELIANYIKVEFDRLYKFPWQCFVGKNFFKSCSINMNSNRLIKFTVDDYSIFLFRTRTQELNL